MVIVQQVLVVGERVDGLHVPAQDAVLVRHRLQRRHDRVGGAGGAGDDLLVRLDHVVVDAVHDVENVTLARRGQDDLGDPRAQVVREALAVAPLAGVVDQDGVVDAVRRVVDGRRVVGVDHLDLVAIGDDPVVRLVDRDRALELTVDGIASQQRGTLDDVLARTLADDDGAQPQTVAGSGLLDEQPGQQTADAAEAVQHDVARLAALDLVGPRGAGDGSGGELRLGEAAVIGLVGRGEHADVDLGGAEIERGEGLEERQGLGDRELRAVDLPGESVGLEDAHHRLVHQGAAVQEDGDIPLAVQLPDDRDHRLRDFLAVHPVGERVVIDSHRFIFRARRRSYGNPTVF